MFKKKSFIQITFVDVYLEEKNDDVTHVSDDGAVKEEGTDGFSFFSTLNLFNLIIISGSTLNLSIATRKGNKNMLSIKFQLCHYGHMSSSNSSN